MASISPIGDKKSNFGTRVKNLWVLELIGHWPDLWRHSLTYARSKNTISPFVFNSRRTLGWRRNFQRLIILWVPIHNFCFIPNFMYLPLFLTGLNFYLTEKARTFENDPCMHVMVAGSFYHFYSPRGVKWVASLIMAQTTMAMKSETVLW